MYWFFRPNIYLFELISFTNATPLEVGENPFLQFLSNHVADALWCLAIIFVVRQFREYKIPDIYSVILLVLPVVSEALQSVEVVPGTFDYLDILVYISLYTICFHREIHNMKILTKHTVGVVVVALFSICMVASTGDPVKYTKGTFRIPQGQDEIFSKPILSKVMRSAKRLSIVLRVPSSGEKVTEEQVQQKSSLYGVIETEFAKAGYIVRDRALFAKVLEQETQDYSKIGKATETDFILEVSRFGEYQYKVETYKDESGAMQTNPNPVTFNGVILDFKLVSVKENDLVGAYTFYYTPCTVGCAGEFSEFGRKKYNTFEETGYIPLDFFKSSARRLIAELEKYR